jgi:DNA/RNA-binding domain of Phe-tRNA-synthetase-like protein
MTNVNFLIESNVLSDHPGMAIGVIVATGVDNSSDQPTAELLREAEQQVRNTYNLESFKEHPNLKAMHEIHRSFGNNPNKFPPSAQALLKRVLKGGQLPSINTLVDLYNVISLRYVVCAGAEDTDLCRGNVRLAYAEGTEHFLPLGEPTEDPPTRGELVYKDDGGVICRKLNWREGDRTKITNNSKNAIVVVEGFPPLTKEKLQSILEELAQLAQQYCKAQTRIAILDKEQSSVEF